MKLRITNKDLDELTFEQKQNLCDLWLPNVYDIAVANVCVDATLEKFEQITYVIGGIKLLKHHDMLLYDLKFMPDKKLEAQEEEACIDCDTEEIVEADDSEDFSFDEDFSFEFQRPDSYTKQDCLPLLDIGQMIDILQRKNFGPCDFSLSVTSGDYVCEMSKDAFSGSNYDINNKNVELCDALWDAVKAIL